jgi:hypothetical protein
MPLSAPRGYAKISVSAFAEGRRRANVELRPGCPGVAFLNECPERSGRV